jgi:hypothetical protein
VTWLVLFVAVAGLAAWKVTAARFWPFVACRWCKGDGKRHAVFGGKAHGHCRHCKGTGQSLRVTRRVMNSWSETKRRSFK